MVCVGVFVDGVVTATGELFKNGLVEVDVDDDSDGGGGGARNDDSCCWVLFASLALNSALKIFIDGTLIFCIVPRVSEKCVTVTVSAVLVAVTPFAAADAVVAAADVVFNRSSVP